ncbi:hypothetical protein SOVF_213310, partial [Spinacia oleracea]
MRAGAPVSFVAVI